MKYDLKKFIKVIDELLTHCMHTFDTRRVDVAIEHDDEAFRAEFRLHGGDVAEAALDAMRQKFEIPRNPELEDYYWQLTGELENSSELDLVAMMCDETRIQFADEVLTIQIVRKHIPS